ncbi:MAG: methionyl-tRNA formyltransferase [Deltaproteobacteria bacterium]|nr:methionyl-tRNA formyltransferase [Deltaproteobacteria bacterium]
MRALFFGTPEIAVPSLEALCEVAEVATVICQPDRPKGRGLELAPPPVKARALALGLEVVQPTKIRTDEFAESLRAKNADVAVVIAYGRILPAAVLSAPRRGCINLHASLLPKLRGAAPIQWAIARGERETGISLMQMDEGCDTGPVFTARSIAIGDDETAGELALRLGGLAASMVRDDLPRAVQGELVAAPQDELHATLAPMLTKADGAIDWSGTAQDVHDRARGMSPWPGAHTTLGGKLFKVLGLRVAATTGSEAPPGTVVAFEHGKVRVACGVGAVHLVSGQVEGKKALDAAQLAAGRTLVPGIRLGDASAA